MRSPFLLGAITLVLCAASAEAARIYPIDRAVFPVGSQFDFKVEFEGVVNPGDVKVTVDGRDPGEVFGRSPTFVEKEKGVDASALLLRDAAFGQPG